MKTLKELIEARKALLGKIDAILDKPEARDAEGKETGELTAEQRTSLDAHKNELRDLDVKIEQAREREENQRKQATLEDESRRIVTPRYTGVQDRLSRSDKRDVERFSLARLVRHLAEGRDPETLDGAEGEFAQEGRSEALASGIEVRSRSVMISSKALRNPELRDLTATGGTNLNQGGMTIATNKMGLLDSLMNASVIRDLGATIMEDLVGNFDVPRIVDGTAPTHKAENAQAAEYSPTTTQVSFSPKRLPTVVEVSNQLLTQSNERALQAFLQNHLTRKLASLMEAAFINGVGSTDAEGILKTTGIGAVDAGTAGAVTYADIIALEKEVAVDNALLGQLAYLTNSKVLAGLKSTAKITSTDSMTIVDDRAGRVINGYPYAITNAVPSNLEEGSTDSLSALIFGNFQDYTAAFWSGVEFLVNPYSKDDYGLTRVNAAVYYDGHVIRPQSFAAKQNCVAS